MKAKEQEHLQILASGIMDRHLQPIGSSIQKEP